MKTDFHLSLALSLFGTLGNAQEEALPVSTVYATQGNVATRQARDEAEMQAAVQAARQEKALKAAMATYSKPQQVISTPEQFLAANPPRVPAVREGGGELSGFIVTKSDEVPEFEPASGGREDRAPLLNAVPLEEASTEKTGFFDRLRAKKKLVSPDPGGEALVNASDPLGQDRPKKSLFSGLFTLGKDREEPVAANSVDSPPVSDVSGILATPASATAISEERVSAPLVPIETPTDEPSSSIFISRQTAVPSGERAIIKKESEANIAGVIVSIREGTEVGILSERGGVATIQMPDQRVGTIKSSALAR